MRLLVESGRRVTVVGRRPHLPTALIGLANYVASDAGRAELIDKAFQEVDEVVYLAYASVPGTSFENPINDILDNLPTAIGALRAASSIPLKKFVLVSSGGAVYGEPVSLPISEAHPTNPTSPYGITKLALEKYAQMYFRTAGVPVVSVRPANAYGLGQRPFTGQGLISTAMASVVLRRRIPLYGEHGTIRDYIHVNDVASGILSALALGHPGECYNIGSGIGRSTREVLKDIGLLAESAGLSIHSHMLPPRRFDVSANILDSSKLAAHTGWRSSTPFEKGLAEAWDWTLQNRAKLESEP